MWGITQAVEASAVILACIGLACFMVWACFMLFYLLVRAIAGGVQILKIHVMRRAMRTDLDRALDSFISDLELGPTMADGGEKTEKYKKQP
jgi:hypothetical protein